MKKSAIKLTVILLALIPILFLNSCQEESHIYDVEPALETVQLKSAATSDYLEDLIETIETLVEDEFISEGQGNALISKIENAMRNLEKGNHNAASGQLAAVVNQVESLIDDGIIPIDHGENLILVTENIITMVPKDLSAEFTIKDGTSWTPANQGLDVASDATIKLFADQASFDNGIPDFIRISDESGIVKFYNMPEGVYLMLVEKDDLSNIVNGYLVAGVYQNEAEIAFGPIQEGATVGGLKYTDVNADGIINDDDKIYHDAITIVNHQVVSETITIGMDSDDASLFQTEQEVVYKLSLCLDKMNYFAQLKYIFDGVFTNTGTSPNSLWDNIETQNLSSTDPKITSLWNDGYATIYLANKIIVSAQVIDMDANNRIQYIGQAKAIRAYQYYHLTNLFGDVPLELEPTANPSTPLIRATINEVFAQVESDLQEAQSVLPVSTGSGISKFFATGLLARLNTQHHNWQEAVNNTEDIINSAQYALTINIADAFSSNSTETILGFDKGNYTEFNSFFIKGNHVPILRYTEIISLYAEAQTQLGNLSLATNFLNELKLRRNEVLLDNSQTVDQLKEELINSWEIELTNEGGWFFTLKRFGVALNRLSISPCNLLLPIPQSVIINNPSMWQNPCY